MLLFSFLIMCIGILLTLRTPNDGCFRAFLIDEYGSKYELSAYTKIGNGPDVDIIMQERTLNGSALKKYWHSVIELHYENRGHVLHLVRPDDAVIYVLRGNTQMVVNDPFPLKPMDKITISMKPFPLSIDYVYKIGGT